MTLTEMTAVLTSLLTRSDLAAFKLSALQAATLKAHRSDLFPKDLSESVVDLGSSLLLHSWAYLGTIPRFRELSTLIRLELAADTEGCLLKEVQSTDLFDNYSRYKTDTYYLAGANIQIRSAAAFQYAKVAVYLDPDVAELTFSSWVATDYPYAIIYEAARAMAITLGMLEEARGFTQLLSEESRELQRNSIIIGE